MTEEERLIEMAKHGAAGEGVHAFRRDLDEDSCPYGDIGGVIGAQREAWLNAFREAHDGEG